MPAIRERRGTSYRLENRRVVGFCSNDYLGFADEDLGPKNTPAAPPGSGASRLICGDLPQLRALEAELAEHVGSEAVLLFPSGFQVNTGVPAALIEAHDRVSSDRLNHASLIDGLRLSSVKVEILEHLRPPVPIDRFSSGKGNNNHNAAVDWWFSETIFSMEGDMIDFEAARAHSERGGALYLDEAHSFGLFGSGSTIATQQGLRPDVVVGTLGKALGCAGAFVATSSEIARWLRGRARSFVFSTGFSPLLAERIRRHLVALRGDLGEERRARLSANTRLLADLLGLDRRTYRSPIFPLLVGDNQRAVAIAQALLDRGWHIQAIRPPTVPSASARLRLTLSALHTAAEIKAMVRDLRDIFADFGVPLGLETGPDPGPKQKQNKNKNKKQKQKNLFADAKAAEDPL